jgi:acyl dehydratase
VLLYLEDLAVGQRFISRTHQLDEEQVTAFARNFDPQPFHVDPVAARDSFFGHLVASGWHTASITMRLLVEGGLPLAGGIVGGGVEISWPQPTQPNALLRAESEILALTVARPKAPRGTVTVRCQTCDQTGAIVQVLKANLVVHRRPKPQGAASK